MEFNVHIKHVKFCFPLYITKTLLKRIIVLSKAFIRKYQNHQYDLAMFDYMHVHLQYVHNQHISDIFVLAHQSRYVRDSRLHNIDTKIITEYKALKLNKPQTHDTLKIMQQSSLDHVIFIRNQFGGVKDIEKPICCVIQIDIWVLDVPFVNIMTCFRPQL